MPTDNITRIPVEYRRPTVVTAAEMWASPEPSDLMVWEICPYTRGRDKMECCGCPATETHPDYGDFTRGCRMLAAEACRVVMAVQRREAKTDGA